ncbi:MAG: class I SAM-dependent methyltransferase [Thermodesulfovibrionales bacterium]|nr:class I SAM-dependent methyltransferase [Thermodesulfovibrionales bacterium]
MDPLGKKELLSFYNRHLKDFGDAPQAVRWTPEGQLRRYENLLRIAGDFSGKTVLDFGCGKGDFYGFLRGKNISVRYCGIDINENLISLARDKYPEAEFIAMDIEKTDLKRNFDYIILCGVFSLRVAGIQETMQNILKMLFSVCTDALHMNALSYYVPQRTVELFYVKPEELLRFALTELSPKVTLTHADEDIYLSVYKGITC